MSRYLFGFALSVWLVSLVILSLTICVESARIDRHSKGRNKNKPPLVEESGKRKGNRQTHCHFGNQSYELEDRWMPNLGPPFGVLYCVRCECVPTPRKKRIVARTRCENIKNVCPKPTCDTPVLLPERCCKTCPGEDNAAIEEDLAMRKLESDDDERNIKEYSVLLTGRGLTPTQLVSGAGRAYLTSFKRHVHYTIYFSGLERPRFVRFKNDDGSIIEEHEIANPRPHVNESKVCGVWRKVPKIYRKLFPKERLSLELTSEKFPEGLVGGKILRNMRINKEVFSSLMIPGSPKSKETLGGGGIAIIYTEANSLYMDLEFNGIFLLTDSRNVPLHIQLLDTTDERQPRAVGFTLIQIPKVHPEYNSVSAKMDLSQEAQLLLYAGQLGLRLSAKDEAMFLFGKITIKVTCNVFQATMVLENSLGEPPASVLESQFAPPMTSNPWSSSRSPVGTAVVSLRPDGSLVYSIESVDLPDQPVLITLDSQDPAKKDLRTLLTTNETFLTDNKVTGIFPKSTKNVQEVEMLLSGDLLITMSTPRGPSWPRLSGRIRQRLYTDAFVNVSPLTLVPESNGTPSAVGQAWISVDKDCDVHYAVYVAGLPIVESPPNQDNDDKNRERHLLELREEQSVMGGSLQQRVLQRLNGEEAEDAQDHVEEIMLFRMKSGFVSLAVSLRSAKGKKVELKGRIINVPIPVTCLPRYQSGFSTGNASYTNDETNRVEDTPHSCIYDRQTFVDGAQWVSTNDNCVMCSCRRSKFVCDKMVCPIPPCDNAQVREGDCCETCPGEAPISRTNFTTSLTGKSVGCYFEGDKRFHKAGTKWHPYIPPFGFSRCALCSCHAENLTVDCKRITCPQLDCPAKDAIRKHPMDCCKVCPNHLTDGQLGDQSRDQSIIEEAAAKLEEELKNKKTLDAGGCHFQGKVYASGQSWNPTVRPFGAERCITCHCKNKRYSCKRKKCPKLDCTSTELPYGECCQRCQKTEEETQSAGNLDRRPPRRRKTRERKTQIKD